MKKSNLQDKLAAQSSISPSTFEFGDSGNNPEGSYKETSPGVHSPAPSRRSLVLDDVLFQIGEAYRTFKITPVELSMSQLGISPKTGVALARMLRETIERHQGEIFTMRHPVLESIGDDIYEDEMKTGFAPRYHVSPGRQTEVLRKVLELGIQVVAVLPSKNSDHLDGKALKSLASNASKLSEKIRAAASDPHVQERMNFLPGVPQIRKLSTDAQVTAQILNSLAKLKVKVERFASPNPQIRFALYLAGWIDACSGRQRYALLADLLEAAFRASNKNPPKWINRLEIEMNRRRQYGAKWFKSVSR